MPSAPQAALRWLYAELPRLVAAGILPESAAQNLKNHYGELPRSNAQLILITIFAVLGATLLGGGLILILAHNWEDLGRPIRAMLSFLPLLLAQGLAFYALRQKAESAAWIESTALFQALMVGASIALVSQTYHIAGDFRAFIQTWMLLALPMVYLMRSTLAGVFYLLLTPLWIGELWSRSNNLGLWILLALIIPFLYRTYRRQPDGWRTVTLGYAFSIIFLIDTIGFLENDGGLWRLHYPALFGLYYLFDAVGWNKTETGAAKRPFYLLGAGGIVVYTFVLSWSYRSWSSRDPWSWSNGLPLLGFWLLSAFFLALALRQNKRVDFLTVFFPLVAVMAYFLLDGATLLINVYGLILGLSCIRRGLQHTRWGVTNVGVLLIAALIMARFFDSDYGLLERGLVFIALGAGFLFVNYLWWRKAKTSV